MDRGAPGRGHVVAGSHRRVGTSVPHLLVPPLRLHSTGGTRCARGAGSDAGVFLQAPRAAGIDGRRSGQGKVPLISVGAPEAFFGERMDLSPPPKTGRGTGHVLPRRSFGRG